MPCSWYNESDGTHLQELVEVPCAKRSAPADSSGDSGKGEGKELKTVLAEKGTDEKDSFLRSGGKEGEEGKGDEQPPKVTPTPPLLAKKDSIEETLLCQICQVRGVRVECGV